MKPFATRLSGLATSLAIGMVMCGLTPTADAQSDRSVRQYRIQEQVVGSRLRFDADPALFNFTLSVAGPDGYYGQVTSARVPPSFRLADHGQVPDGLYQFEMTAATPERRQSASPREAAYNGREPNSGTAYLGYSYTGSFRVVDGRIIEFDQSEQEG
ncbi:hypothetical protein [Maricaulis parjimensis]|uniref:hypothetical protein n=1 Tax=Maricaulis parjimensis TaxID=144023 RepID=UPI00193AA202|nr:hypothetical protein [Maricaulis parjimensis]